MGTGTSRNLAKTHGPSNPDGSGSLRGCGTAHDSGRISAMRRGSSAMMPANGAGRCGGDVSLGLNGNGTAKRNASSPLCADGGEGGDGNDNPLGEDDLSLRGGLEEGGSFTPLETIVGKDGSDAKYVKKRPIGKGAYGEAYIVERNAGYNPANCPLAEHQINNNQLTHPTRVGGTYVIKIVDLRNMRQQDRQYAQTEIICIAHTYHFAIIKYYEHYVLDSEDETMVIVTEFADHGDLARNLSRARDAQLLGDMASPTMTTSRSTSSNVLAHSVQSPPSGGSQYPAGATKSPNNSLQHVSALQLTEREAGMYFVQLLAALHHIHKRRMIHRDVKSANLFLTSHGFIKLGDFGFSQKYESTVSSETIAGTFLGTPYYVSPEMWKSTRYGKKADVWAAGIVLYEMLMDGQRPFEAMSLTDLRRVVLERDVVLPECPPDTSSNAVAAASDGSAASRRPKFSPEIRELVRMIFQKDPHKRPSTEDLLRTPIMQHYLFLFQRHVESLFAEDAALVAANPTVNRAELAFPDEADKTLVLEGLEELNNIIKQEIEKELKDPGALRYEGVVYKGNRGGTWKERYLALEDDVLVISLSRAKAAAEGAERSRKVPMKLVKAVNVCQSSDPHVQPMEGGKATGYVPPFAFVLFMQESSSPIYFGVASAQDLDNWMKALATALRID